MDQAKKQHCIAPWLRDLATELRNTPTHPEWRLWQLLRKRQLAGLKFRRQHSITPYIVDFYCPTRKLIIEVDGESHSEGLDADRARDADLRGRGNSIVRVTNDDVLLNLEGVAIAILRAAGIDPEKPLP